jgi:hypothetical protein
VGGQRVDRGSQGDVPSSSYGAGSGRVRSTGFVRGVGSVVVVRIVTGGGGGGVVSGGTVVVGFVTGGVVSSSVVVRLGGRVEFGGYGGGIDIRIFSNDRDDGSRLSRRSVDHGCDDGSDDGRRSTVRRRSRRGRHISRLTNRGGDGVEGGFGRPRCLALTDPTE